MNEKCKKENIVIIGMSGAGKSTVGKYVGQKLNMEFIDTDDIIIESTGKTIDRIFEEYGEDFFRHLESDLIKRIYSFEKKVIATGGGVILNSENIRLLKNRGVVFFLSAKVDTIYKNLISDLSDDRRPLLKNTENLYEAIENLYMNRKDKYFSSADYIIDVDEKTLDMVGDEIISIFKSLSSCS